MKFLHLLVVGLLSAVGSSLTFNLDQSSSDAGNTVLIIRKSKPSILIFPNNQSITLNYPKQHRILKLNLDGAQPTISFKDLNALSSKQQVQKTKNKNKGQKKPKAEQQNQKQKQVSAQSQQVPTKSNSVSSEFPTLRGTYKLTHFAHFNLKQSIPIKIQGDHISYTICSHNTCEITQEKSQVEVGSCTLVSRPQCQPFSELFYSDLRFLAQIELISRFRFQEGRYKFYDKQHELRFQLSKQN